MAALYTIAIYLYYLGIRLLSLFSPKARQWVAGRRGLWIQLEAFRADLPVNASVLWIHCASLGEFEQGRPVIEAMRDRFPDVRIVLSFFSPSGYEVRKEYDQVDLVCYLPIDLPGPARRFVTTLRPDLAIFVKYEFWYHHLRCLHEAEVPTLLISAIFRPEQLFFRSYAGWYRQMLFFFEHIFVQDESSARLLEGIGYTQITVAGDSRVDRVLQLSRSAPEYALVARFTADHPVWIAGSTWPADEQLLLPFFAQHLPDHWRIILAPHEIGEAHLQSIEAGAEIPLIRYSRAQTRPEELADARMLLIDNIGMLSSLYQYGRLAYIGGGFGKAIHNLLEPIAFRLPVLFGPRHEKFQEANYLIRHGGGYAVQNAVELRERFEQLQDEEAYQQAAEQAYAYLLEQQGSTEKIIAYLAKQYSGSDF